MSSKEIHLYNTMSRSKELFKPINKGILTMYNCGPTVYDTPHIGNYRTFVLNDLIRRTFEYNGYEVKQVMNITDVDDKTIRRSRAENIKLASLTKKYEELFFQGLTSLNILRPQNITHATEYISAMIELVQSLLDNGVAYKAKDGIYVSIDKVKNYGTLACIDLSKDDNNEHNQERISNDEYDKENPRDFAVWKFRSEDDGDVFWPASFGEGRPGWHIECSAMSMKVLGPTMDIHTGGSDLIFPHHTNEIAQSESATGKSFVHYWIHGGFMNVNGDKMSKSKNNFSKLEELSEGDVSPIAFRYWLLTAHYRTQINFTFEAVKAAQNAFMRLVTTIAEFPTGGVLNTDYKDKFTGFINDDFDMPKAVALTWDLMKDSGVSDGDKRATILDFDKVFGLGLDKFSKKTIEIPLNIKTLANEREVARQNKDWVKADDLRQKIEDAGYEISDKDGQYLISPLS